MNSNQVSENIQPLSPAKLRRLLGQSTSILLFGPRKCAGCGADLVSQAQFDGRRAEIAVPVESGRIILHCPVCEGVLE